MTFRHARAARSRLRFVAMAACALMAAGTLQAVPAAARPSTGHTAGAARTDTSVPGHALPRRQAPKDHEAGKAAARSRPVWPAARGGTLAVGGARTALPGTGLSVYDPHAAHAAQVAVRTLPQATVRALGGVGYAFTAAAPAASGTAADPAASGTAADPAASGTAADLAASGAAASDEPPPHGGGDTATPAATAQPVTVTLDYAGFRYAAGGGFADRLRLRRLPACVLASPACAARPVDVPAHNDVAAATITADVRPDAGAVYVLASAASGDSGDYRATDLKPSGKWSVGQQSGDFSYSYPLPLPPSPYGKAPALSLDYSAQSVDGRTSATNNQASWAGLGWDLIPGFIERKYRACVDDGSDTLSDLCWYSPYSSDEEGAEYVISLNGTTTELIKDGSGVYHAEDDPGWKIQHTYDGTNSDNSDEAWVVSTPDGTRYFFGYHEDSNLTVPVVGNDTGEPCHDSGQSLCRQTYRWNLDEIRDPNENHTRLYWTKETNSYKRFNNGDIETYDRGSYLDRVEYGMQEGQQPSVRVDFTSVNRCLSDIDKASPDCADPTPSSGTDYPDVPVDLICGSSCTKNSPSFFVVRRLASISTQVWNPATSAFMEVNRIQPTFALPNPVGATDAMLWLNYLQVFGKWGDDVTLPALDFDGAYLNNRVDYPSGDTTAAMPMRRITSVQNGLGGEVNVHYGHGSTAASCPSDGSTSTWESGKHWDTNTQECFRVDYKPEGATSTTHGVFQKYVVTSVDQVDLVGGSPAQTTAYAYLGDPAWHYDDEPTAPADQQVWSDWRGYGEVRQTDGTGPNAQRSVTETMYFRGMYGDKLSSGGTKSDALTDWDGNTFQDNHAKAGEVLQAQHFRLNTDGSRTELADERYTYWDSGITANGSGLHNAYMIRPFQTRARQLKADGTWRETGSDQDGYSTANGGLPTRKVAWGEIGTGADNTCTEITYAQNTDDWRWMLDYTESEELHSGDPDPSTAQCPGPAVSRTVTLYDNAAAPGTADRPIDGNPTEIRHYSNDTTYAPEKKGYDVYGRVTSDEDADLHTTYTSYTPSSGWPMDGTKTTDPLNHVTTTYTSRAFGTTTRTVDPNGLETTTDYDGAGRIERVWLPTEPKSTGVDVPPPAGAIPSYQYSYHLTLGGTAANSQPSKPTVVTTQQLRSIDSGTPHWLSTYAYLDGFGRTREVQAPAPSGSGRTVTDTTYDERGLAKGTSAPYWNSAAPGDDPSLFVNPQRDDLPSWTEKTYDALQRESASTLYASGSAQRTTTTANYGDGKVVTPPKGGRAAYWNDGFDRLAKVQENVPAGGDVPPPTVATTTYGYSPRGDLASVTDASGDVTTYGYDWTGRRTSTKDPDAGASTTAYDGFGNVVATTDAAGKTLAYTYDPLNRKRTEWSGSVGNVKLAEWTYDTVPFPGQTGTPTKFVLGRPAATTRYVSGKAYRVDVTGYDLRYQVTGRTWTVPSAEGFGTSGYSVGYGYDRAGHQISLTYPPAGGLPAETVTTGYSATGRPDTLTSPVATYVTSTAYSGSGRLAGRSYGADGSTVRQYTYEPTGAQRLASVATQVAGATVQNDTYGYDDLDDLTSVTDHAQAAAQNQCYAYDALQRLSDAWTSSGLCTSGPSGADGTGTDPYRLSYTYDPVGDMTSVTDDGTTRGYGYPAPGAGTVRPHAVTSIGPDSYGYDSDGRLTSRTVDGTSSTLGWDDDGDLTSVTPTGSPATTFAYSADKDRLIRRDGASTTLYLDGTELRLSGGTISATRYYLSGTSVVAMRTAGGVQWLGNDQQNSTQVAVDAATGAVSRQRYLPYGAHRGATDALPSTDRGFLGKTEDASTDLDQIGARYYDPSTGKFISPDPLYDTAKPQSLNPYTYADGNPTTFSDPTGLRVCDGSAGDFRCVKGQRPDGRTTAEVGGEYGGSDNSAGSSGAPRHPSSLGDLLKKIAAVYGGPLSPGCLATALPTFCPKVNLPKTFVSAFCRQHAKVCALPSPDYLVLDGGVGDNLGLVITRNGDVTLSTGLGTGKGVSFRGGWIFSKGINYLDLVRGKGLAAALNTHVTPKDISGFPLGPSTSASVEWEGVTFGVTVSGSPVHWPPWKTGPVAVEAGVSAPPGNVPALSGGGSYGWGLGNDGFTW